MNKLTAADIELVIADQQAAEYRGFIALPGTGRQVYWTGRVAIGIRHQPSRDHDAAVPHSTLWLQQLMLDGKTAVGAK